MARLNTGLVLSRCSPSLSSSLSAAAFLVALLGRFDSCYAMFYCFFLFGVMVPNVSDEVYGFKYWQDGNAFPHGVLGVINSLVLASLSMQGKMRRDSQRSTKVIWYTHADPTMLTFSHRNRDYWYYGTYMGSAGSWYRSHMANDLCWHIYRLVNAATQARWDKLIMMRVGICTTDQPIASASCYQKCLLENLGILSWLR